MSYENLFDHGEHQYTLRQFLLMRRLNLGGEWPDVLEYVNAEIAESPEWDINEMDTYQNWRTWYYYGNRDSDSGSDSASNPASGELSSV